MIPESLLRTVLLLAGIAHFCILGASAQVPYRLMWKQELMRLSPLNRKLMWTYGGFIAMTILAFGWLTLALRGEMVNGDRAAVLLAAFIGVFWTLRIIVDFVYFGHEGWPSGRMFQLGHVLLTATFIAIASAYWTVVLYHTV